MIRDYPRMVSSLVMALLTNTDTLDALLVAQIIAIVYTVLLNSNPEKKKTSTSKINPNESVLLLYIDI